MIFLILVISIAGKIAWDILLRMDRLGIDPDQIEITGNNMVSDNMILDILGIRYGENILAIKVSDLEERLESFPRIKAASIIRDFPNVIKIEIQEDTPIGYQIKDEKRYVVCPDRNIFPGLEGPAIEFRPADAEKVEKLGKFLMRIGTLNEGFHRKIIALDCNYRDEIIVYLRDFYSKWPEVSKIDDLVIEKNIYLLDKIEEEYSRLAKKITYVDLRFVRFVNEKIEGALIVK
ncbi:MAG: FtsQ-type POTRA domain-containing protein [Elusimicrobiota bacterium]